MLDNEQAETETTETETPTAPWQKLERIDRRVVGVLVEKAKTTPENYPLTLNSLINACNQKSNRFPQMQLDEGHVDESLDRLRGLGAVSEVQGDGRVEKFRHLLYDWLGVDKYELAVMAELLLRGAQTLGELRGRANRMEAIAGISDLRPIIDNLYRKGLIMYLTPPGRGCVVTHALYQDQELDKVRAEYGGEEINVPMPSAAAASPTPAAPPTSYPASVAAPTAPDPGLNDEVELLRAEVEELRETVQQLQVDMEKLQAAMGG